MKIAIVTAAAVAALSGSAMATVYSWNFVAGQPQGGLLEGVTRRFVMDELAPMCGYEVEEKMMRLEEVVDADEVFLTGTAAEIIAVPQIDTPDGVAHKISVGEGKITFQGDVEEIVSGRWRKERKRNRRKTR